MFCLLHMKQYKTVRTFLQKKRPPERPLLRFCNVNIFENQYYFK